MMTRDIFFSYPTQLIAQLINKLSFWSTQVGQSPVTKEKVLTERSSCFQDQWEFQDPIHGGTVLVPFFRPYFAGDIPIDQDMSMAIPGTQIGGTYHI